MRYVRAWLGCALAVFLQGAVHAAFLDDGWGARPVGMGGAFTAIADDANAPLFNPAGLSQIQSHQVSAMYARLFSGLTLYAADDQVHIDQSYLAYASRNTGLGAFGLSWANFNTTHLYREDTVTLSYGKNVGDFITSFDRSLSVGANLKYLRRSVALDAATANDPVFASGTHASAVAFDLALLYKPEAGMLANWRIGAAAKNINQPNVGFQDHDPVPVEYRLGVAYQSRERPWLVPDVDFVRRDGVNDIHAGIESWLFHDVLALRTGVNRDEAAAGLSFYQGVGKNFGFRIDYGFTIPFYVEGTGGSHRLQASVYF